jgi:hypothetical protein
MATAIGVSTVISSAAVTGGGASPVALQAQLDRCSKQLGDWVSCASAKTPEGQQVIQALQQKISDLRARIESADSAPPTSGQSPVPTTPSATPPANPPPLAGSGTLGTLLYTTA